jgi:hypothetical protein
LNLPIANITLDWWAQISICSIPLPVCDMFAMPFHEIATIVGRSPEATRQLASRARRRVQDAAPPPDPDMTRQRAVIVAYFATARERALEALVAVLDPDVVYAPTAVTTIRSSCAAPSGLRAGR